MNIFVDLIVIGLIAIFVIVGIKRGFAREIIDFLITILLIPICMILMIPVSGIIVNTTKIDKNLNTYIVETVVKLKNTEDVKENNKNEGLLETEINKIIKQNRDKGIEEVANIAGKNITDGIIKGISFIAAYVLLTIVVIIFRTTILGIIENIRNNKRNKQYFRRGIWSNKSTFDNIYSINNSSTCKYNRYKFS